MRPTIWWQVWSCVAANVLAAAACNKGPGYEDPCKNGPAPPTLDVYLGPSFHGGKVTTSGACTQVEFVELDERNNEVWRGHVTSAEGTCTVTVTTADGKMLERTVVNTELCGAPQEKAVFFGVFPGE